MSRAETSGSGNLNFTLNTNYYSNGNITTTSSGSTSGYTFNDFLNLDYTLTTGNGVGSTFAPTYYNAYVDWASSLLVNAGNTIDYSGLGGLSDFPIGAFYESTSPANDPAPSIAASTPRLLNAAGQGLTEYGLSTFDTNFDGKLTGAELTNLRAWVDANENGVADAGEIKALANAGIQEIRQINYIYYAAGNAITAPVTVTAPTKPGDAVTTAHVERIDRTQVVPASNYRSLRDTDNAYPTLGAPIIWTAADIKINWSNKSYLIGTDGNDAFDIYYFGEGSIFNLSLIVNFLGGNGDDIVGGSARNDNVWGGFGNDTLLGYAGDDNLYGEENDDELQGRDGNDYLDGGTGNDTLFGHVGNDVLNGGAGNDILLGFTPSNDPKQTLSPGETDDDYLYGGGGSDRMFGGLGNDYLDGGSENDVVGGGAGDDYLYGGENDDVVFGDEGNDYLDGGSENDEIAGDAGNDRVFGGAGNDELQGNEGNDSLAGEAGNDRMFGQVGNDTMWGGDGNDLMIGFTAINEAQQTLNAGETDNDTMFGGAGMDELYGGFGDDTLDGGDDQDFLLGDQGDDTLFGGNNEDELQGGVGNDRLLGEAGNDNMFGQVGNDTMWGGDGDDVMLGFTASNEAKQSLSAGETDNDTMYGGNGNDLMLGGLGDDVLQGDVGSDQLQGGYGNDLLYGGTGNDRLFGQVGNDVLYGGDGDDILVGFTGYNEAKQSLFFGETDNNWLYGGAGNDILLGGLGSDYLDGGAGADIMEGGKGDDFYVVNSVNDTILELAGEGYDFVLSSSNYLLNANIEELRLLEGYNIHGTGNALNNLIIGNSSDNILDGVTGADQMRGAAGNDTYYVDNLGDQTIELAGEGTDTVQSTISVTLSANVENLILLDFAKPEKGLVDGTPALVYGYPKANELDYTQGDAVPDFWGTCALTSIANLLTQADRPTTESDVVNRAITYGWAVIDPTLPPYVRGGSNYMDQQALLDSYGIRNDLIAGYNEEGVANLIRSGRGVIIAVNAGILWGEAGYVDGGIVNHVVTVTGAVYGEANGELLGFYIADSGRHKVSDMTRFVDIATFRQAANVPFAYAIYTKEALKLWDEAIDGTGNTLGNVLVGNRADNVLVGLGGDDTLEGGAGNDTLDGGAGVDIAIFSGKQADYAISSDAGTHRVTAADRRAGSPDGVDTATGVEMFQFADGSAEFDSDGRLTRSIVIGGDGSKTTTVYDATGTQTWSAQMSSYDSAGILRTMTESGDDGSLSVTRYDPDQIQPWASYTSTYGNSGRLTALKVVADDGGTQTTQYDPTDIAAWSLQTGAGGAGTQSFNIVDTADAFGWSSYTNVVDSNGSLLSQAGTLDPDNGGHWLNAYDTTGAFSWSSYFNAYNPTGELIWQSGTEDNGAHWLTVFDPTNTYSWSQATISFDTNWNMMALAGLNDDGSHAIDTNEFYQVYDALAWSPSAYIPTQHLWPQGQLWGGAVAENAIAGTIVGAVAGAMGYDEAGNRDGGTVQNFALTASAGGKFAIDAATGVVTVAVGAQFDYESAPVQTITVRTTDSLSNVVDQTFTIAITNVNEAPAGATLNGGMVAENSANGTVIGTVAGIDPDAGSTFSYLLTDNAGGRFAINAATGVLTVANGTLLNYETASSHGIVVRVTDQGGLTFDKSFTVALTDANDAPTGASLTGGTVAENSANGTIVGTVMGADPDAGAALTYSLANSASGRFAINATTGVVTVANGALLDYESASSQTITVRVIDQGGLFFDKNFTISITNANDAPTGATMTGGTVAENAANGTVVGAVTGTDPDAGSTFSYALVDNAGGRFAINASTGVVTVANGALLDYETAASQTITARITDQGGLSVDKPFSIGLTNVNDAPTGVTLSNSSVMEHVPSQTAVGVLNGVDPDSGSTFTYQLIDDAGGLFRIKPGTTTLETAGNWRALDYATANFHTVRVKVTDQAGLTYTQSLTIAVTPDHTEVTNGDGSTTKMIYDAPDLYTWSSFRTEADAQGRLTYQIGITDGGGTWENEYDAANTQSWSTRMTVTNAAHQVVSRTTVNDNNTMTLVAYDVGNIYDNWSTFTMQFTYVPADPNNPEASFGWTYASTSGTTDVPNQALDMNQVWNSFDTLLWYSNPYVVTQGSLGGEGDGLPIILDLDGNGVTVSQLGVSTAMFDMTGTGQRVETAWADTGDAFLAIDVAADGEACPDGVIDQAKEIVFTQWAPGATSDMQALRQVFDTNRNGALDAGDSRWSEFRIWQDANGDGVSAAGEVGTLAQFGITSIGLDPGGPAESFADGSAIGGVSTYTRSDGTTGIAADVSLAYRNPQPPQPGFLPAADSIATTLLSVHSFEGSCTDSELNQLVQAMAIHLTGETGFLSIAAANAVTQPKPAVIAPSWH